MDLTSMFSDDQLAVIGCCAAIAVCGLIAAISYHFGPAGRHTKPSGRDVASTGPVRMNDADKKQERRAA